MEITSLVDRILYRDAMMLIIDKPAGLAVHEGGSGGPSLRPMLDQLTFGLPRPPELAHRLDRDTSGCLVLGRHRKALADLGALFAEGKIKKTYWALTVGTPGGADVGEEGLIDRPLKKIDQRRGKMGVAKPGDKAGQPSQTKWKVLGKSPDGRTAWLELSPLTGRTHQLRVHLASVGCPILGDRIYGAGTADLLAPQLCLHARAVSVPLYKNKPAVSVEAEPPEHMREGLTALDGAVQADFRG
jgi:tRNA pseudouridine32 synthase/23S rRNA pseudouridine746 synthase